MSRPCREKKSLAPGQVHLMMRLAAEEQAPWRWEQAEEEQAWWK
jgi:hypothetical protein